MNIAEYKKITIPSQYFMFYSGKHDEAVYILVDINIHVGKDVGIGHYVCDVLD